MIASFRLSRACDSPARTTLLPAPVPVPRTDVSSPTRHLVFVPPPSMPRKKLTSVLVSQPQTALALTLDHRFNKLGTSWQIADCHAAKPDTLEMLYLRGRGRPPHMQMGLNRLDLAIIAVYLVGITLFGLRFRKRQRTLRDYFLADRNIPWWAIALSIVAAETSTLTIISIPGLAYDSNLTFLQVVMGYVVGRVIISIVLLPHYFRGDLYTAYELIERRFGPRLRSVTAGLFLITRAAAEGVRVYAVSIVVAIALGTGQIASIAIITVLTLIYTFEGGLAAVIWTDVVQTAIYVGGTLVGLVTILHVVPGGWPAIHD